MYNHYKFDNQGLTFYDVTRSGSIDYTYNYATRININLTESLYREAEANERIIKEKQKIEERVKSATKYFESQYNQTVVKHKPASIRVEDKVSKEILSYGNRWIVFKHTLKVSSYNYYSIRYFNDKGEKIEDRYGNINVVREIVEDIESKDNELNKLNLIEEDLVTLDTGFSFKYY